jgi:hypothetical protein
MGAAQGELIITNGTELGILIQLCFGEANMNSYKENEMRKLGAKVQFCAEFALCAKPAQDNLRK